MKIEKLNENQIRCTLSKEDLKRRRLRLSELAYGTEKAQELFADLMRAASKKYGFEAGDMPVMIEAIPLSKDSITLIVTKVAYPDELDTRFAHFTEDPHGGTGLFGDESEGPSALTLKEDGPSAREIIDLSETSPVDRKKAPNMGNDTVPVFAEGPEYTRMFTMKSLDDLIRLSHVLHGYYRADNVIYHPADGPYILLLYPGSHTAEEFNRIINIASEYGTPKNKNKSEETYLAEHCRPLLKQYALQQLEYL